MKTENIQPTQLFNSLKEWDWIECYNGDKGFFKSKDNSNYYVTVEYRGTTSCFHILNIKEVVSR